MAENIEQIASELVNKNATDIFEHGFDVRDRAISIQMPNLEYAVLVLKRFH